MRPKPLSFALAAALVASGCSGPSQLSSVPPSTTTSDGTSSVTAAATSVPRATTTVSVSPSTTDLVAPRVTVPVGSPGVATSSAWWLLAGPSGLAVLRGGAPSVMVVADPVRAGLVLDERRVVFQRAVDGAPVEVLDVISRRVEVLVAADVDRVVRLEDVGRIGGRAFVLLTRAAASGLQVVRRDVDGAAEVEVAAFAAGSVSGGWTLSASYVDGTVDFAGEQRSVHLTVDGAAGSALPTDCATAPCARWECRATTDPCRTNLTAAASSSGSFGVAFVERRQGEQVVVLAEFANDGTYATLDGWVSLPAGTIVAGIRVSDGNHVVVNTWASPDRRVPGRAIVVDARARSAVQMAQPGFMATARIVDPAPFDPAARVAGVEVVANAAGLWVLTPGGPPRRLLDVSVAFARVDANTVVAQRVFDSDVPDRTRPVVAIDVSTGEVRELFAIDGSTGEPGHLLTTGVIDSRAYVFYRREIAVGGPIRPPGTVMLYRRALDGGNELAVASLGVEAGLGSDVVQGVQVVGGTVVGMVRVQGISTPVAFDIDGRPVDLFASVSYCDSEGRCTSTPPTCEPPGWCVTHVAVSADASRLAFVLSSWSPEGMQFELLVVDAHTGTVVATGRIPNNPAVTLVGGLEWRGAGRIVVQTFAPTPGAVVGTVLYTSLNGSTIGFGALDADGFVYTQRFLIT